MTIITKIEFAWGANLTALPGTWTWTDESLRALGSVRLEYGKQDEAGQTQPTRAGFRLSNTDERYSPRHALSALYPNVRLQTPVRISINPGSGLVQRVILFVTAITPVWPSGNEDTAEAEVTAAGLLQRLGAGEVPTKSPLYRAYVAGAPTAYWSLEDLPGAVRAESPIAGIGPMQVVGNTVVSFGSQAGPAGSAPVVRCARDGLGGFLYGMVPTGGSPTSWQVEFSLLVPALTTTIPVAQWLTLGTVRSWECDVAPQASGGLSLKYVNSAGVPSSSYLSNARIDDGVWHHIRIQATTSGGNFTLIAQLDGTTVVSTGAIGGVLDAISQVQINPGVIGDATAPAAGHVAVWQPVTAVDTLPAFYGHSGETAGARIVRVAAEEGIPAAVSSTSETAAMGPQPIASPLAIFRDCETVDGGLLTDGGTGGGLTYLAAQDRMSLAVTMALDCNRGQVKLPFSPTEDDQRVRNRWTVARLNGGAQGVTVQSDEHIAANNGMVYDDSTSLNVAADTQLRNEAGWRVGLGTVEEMRVPGLQLELVDRPELWTLWLAMAPGRRMTAVNLPAQYPPGTLDMALEGAVETWDAVSWRVECSTGPYAPWRVAKFAADTGDAGEFVGRFDTDGCVLPAAVTAGALTALVATTSGTLWTAVADDLPIDVGISGQQNRVSAVAAAVTDTFTRSVSSGLGTSDSGQAWTTSGGSAADYGVSGSRATMAITSTAVERTASIANVGATVDITAVFYPTVVATVAQFEQKIRVRWSSSSLFYESNVQYQTDGTIALYLTRNVTALSSLAGVMTYGSGTAVGVRLQAIGSTIRHRIWDASGTEPLAWTATVTDAVIPGSETDSVMLAADRIAGNTNTTLVVQFDNLSVPNPQRFTFSARGVNGVAKALPSGSAVSLWAPPVFAK